MTIDELEIIIRANITDAISGIKEITDEVKKAVANSIEPMKQLTSQAKNMASNSASTFNKMKTHMKDYANSIKETAKQEEYLKFKIDQLKEDLKLMNLSNGFSEEDILKANAELEQMENKLKQIQKGSKISFDGIKKKLKEVSSSTKSFGKTLSNSFEKGIKSIKKFGLSLIGARTLFAGVRKAISSYLSFDDQLSKSVQNCWNVLGSLLAPILEKVIGLFTTLVSYVNAFVKALTGVDLVARANAKALDKQAKSAKKATSAQSSLDELHTINKNDDSDTSGTSISVDNVNLESLKDKIFNFDWESIGQGIGDKINNALSKINWSFIKKLASSLAFDLANLINGMLTQTDWSLVGNTLGSGIQTAILFAYTFVTTFDWAGFGNAIADTIMGWFSAIDWEMAGRTISSGIRGLFQVTKNLIANINWIELGNDVWKFISNIDWSGMIKDLAYILGQTIAGIGQFLWGFIKDAVISVRDYFAKEFDKAGGDIIAGLLKGILDALINIGVWLYDNVVEPLVEGFKSLFGIHSPSTVMVEIGNYLIEGLKEGLLNIWTRVQDIFENLKANIINVFTSTRNKIKETFNISTMKNHFSNVATAIKSAFSNLPTWFKNIFNATWSGIKSILNTMISGFEKFINFIIKGLNSLLAPLRKIGNGILGKVGLNVSIPAISTVSIPKLRYGNVATKEMIVDVAEYPNARNNPEIISPRDMMKETMLEAIEESSQYRQSQDVNLKFEQVEQRLEGSTVVTVYDIAKSDKGYNGKKNPLFAY